MTFIGFVLLMLLKYHACFNFFLPNATDFLRNMDPEELFGEYSFKMAVPSDSNGCSLYYSMMIGKGG